MKYFSVVFIIGLLFFNNNLICQVQIQHNLGTKIINGIEISVTPIGAADTLLTYCPESTSPYFIGYSFEQEQSLNGSYIFEFDPSIDSIQLNFSGISPGEFIEIFVNNEYNPIQSPGNPNDCDDLAILTPNGNITGCENCFASGWTGTSITGPISKIEVSNKVLIGDPQGSLFSIFIFNEITSTTNSTLEDDKYFFPNPTDNVIRIKSAKSLSGTIKIFDLNGRFLNQLKINSHNQNSFKLDLPRKGFYFISFENDTIRFYEKVLLF